MARRTHAADGQSAQLHGDDIALCRRRRQPQREEWTRDYHETRARMERSYDVLRMVRILRVNLDSNPPDAQ
ncbi:MAG TPA: hypothetical protein VGS80_08970 [Ktedonobacterales bacterium]|nr:hypothetical protein [Ktedonobacterales bacterium]